jgi:endo-1,4-beta-D-glucanase Y
MRRLTVLSLVLSMTVAAAACSSSPSSPDGTGVSSTGGSGTGGRTDGSSSGGKSATGGIAATGGSSAGGTGGKVATGGNSSGGANTGGAKGGAGTGGAAGATGPVGGMVGSTGGTFTIPSDPCAPRNGYRSLFTELLGKSDADATAKLDAGYKSLFHGGQNETVYYEGGGGAYIEDINDGDVRTEGQSYGMMISVQMDKKAEFDKIWIWTKQHMGMGNGLFSWKASTSGSASGGSAPDGEEYFATALIFASHRWGDGADPLNYSTQAKTILNAIATNGTMWNQSAKIITFGNTQYTDPSYWLPAFYQVWACFDTAHASQWTGGVTSARSLFQKNSNATTGLGSYLANFDGSPNSTQVGQYAGNSFESDSWRIVGNIMMDYSFFAADPWQKTWAMKYATFFKSVYAMNPVGDEFNLDGTVRHSNAKPSGGLLAQNALVAFAAPADLGTPLLKNLWDQAPPTGQYRYYDGMLYMLAALHASGHFHLW